MNWTWIFRLHLTHYSKVPSRLWITVFFFKSRKKNKNKFHTSVLSFNLKYRRKAECTMLKNYHEILNVKWLYKKIKWKSTKITANGVAEQNTFSCTHREGFHVAQRIRKQVQGEAGMEEASLQVWYLKLIYFFNLKNEINTAGSNIRIVRVSSQ